MNLLVLFFAKPFTFTLLMALGAACSSNNNPEQQQNVETTNQVTASGSQNVNQDHREIGVGPFKTVELGDGVDMPLAEQGKALFEGRCTACHKFEDRFVGPALAGITERRNPVWIMNMIINPSEMIEKDPIAKELLAEYQAPMMNMGVNEADTRAILEYLRAHDQGKMD